VNRHLARLAAVFAGLAIAASAVAPALATTTIVQPGDTALEAPATTDTGIARCAAAWVAVRADRTLENTQAVVYCEVDRRLDAIDRLHALVDNADVLTAAHAASLTTILDGSASGLTALRARIAADTTVASATADVRRIFTDYRVYVLVSRQVLLVRADDGVGVAADRLATAAGQLESAIEQAESNGRDVTAARRHLEAMTAAMAAARGEVAGDPAAILGQTPADWNAGTAKPVLDAGRASVSAARTDLRTALREARAVLAALR
jgi:hypothetical protein